MNFIYSKYQLNKKERRLQRLLEIVPGATSWSVLIGMLILSLTKPLIAAIFVIAFDFYWFLRLLYMTLFLIAAYCRLSIEKKTNWMERILSLKTSPRWEDIRHLVIIPIVKESREIIEPGISSLSRQKFPGHQILVVLAVEERAEERIQQEALEIASYYRKKFLDCTLVMHPDGLPGEARVKGANATWAAKHAAALFKTKGILFENVVVSCFDADTVVSPEWANHILRNGDCVELVNLVGGG